MTYTTDPGGCITSTPKLLSFLKKSRFWAKNERASCMPGPKNGERPYLAVPEATFWGLFLGIFSPIFIPTHPYFASPSNPPK